MYEFQNYPRDSEAYETLKRKRVNEIARRIANENHLDYDKLNFAERNSIKTRAVFEICDNIFKKGGE